MHSIAHTPTYARPIPPSSDSTLKPSQTHILSLLSIMMPFANVTKSKRNRGVPPVSTPASKAKAPPANPRSKPKPDTQLVRKPLLAPPPRNPVSSSTDHYDENRSSPPPKTPSSNRTRQYLQAESHRTSAARIDGEHRNDTVADDPDPEAAPPPERPEGSDWQQLVDILFGRTL